ncbi:unnamed protein product [Diamesa hyperborea]
MSCSTRSPGCGTTSLILLDISSIINCTKLILNVLLELNVSGFNTICGTNIDDCDSQPCLNGGFCSDAIAGYSCECPPGYTGLSCETNINDCVPNPCHRGICIDGDNSFTCQCNPGYTGNLCQTQINKCESNPCQYSGFRDDLIGGYRTNVTTILVEMLLFAWMV